MNLFLLSYLTVLIMGAYVVKKKLAGFRYVRCLKEVVKRRQLLVLVSWLSLCCRCNLRA